MTGTLGPKGEDGVPGYNGVPGAKGEPGLQGPQGEGFTEVKVFTRSCYVVTVRTDS